MTELFYSCFAKKQKKNERPFLQHAFKGTRERARNRHNWEPYRRENGTQLVLRVVII